ncbi:hypothetical protein FNE58_09995 [Bacillus thuringiensis]|uniref:Uncharacterized protein n=1 Tax=Bacillus thuringiensis TaxID=1428 RepID=A0A9X6KRG3_BACTU|nr:hypothetical protein YBT1520_30199 [Bacillus thuringiensis serovar kurstaki str. YBT-1520]AIE37600.1 hypothetical protein BTK_29999 [Bacillus thuringiensis serovar kurstaki str. HD-1]AJA23082.1 hypothetical protein BT4G5_30025 [Bacillus thuringiensis serovar galleriae]AKJ62421.1 hypothetical protein XI92_30095 [Bacillus thuringiensis]ETE89302.1 hypothetical protein C621_0225225 [Bacillus thuringiensis serovar aizawai str. Leapi01]ETE98012.1 hypothetical protein C623_0211445 [Bacillus thurin
MEFYVPITLGKHSVCNSNKCKSNHAFTDTKKELLVKLTAPGQGISKGKRERLRTLNEFWLMPIRIIDGIMSFIHS